MTLSRPVPTITKKLDWILIVDMYGDYAKIEKN